MQTTRQAELIGRVGGTRTRATATPAASQSLTRVPAIIAPDLPRSVVTGLV
jgi:hypothetical protein